MTRVILMVARPHHKPVLNAADHVQRYWHPPALSVPPSLPPSSAVEQPLLLLPAHYSEGLKKAAGGVKIAARQLCLVWELPACRSTWIPTSPPQYPPPHLHHNHQDDGAAATSSAPPPKPTDTSSEQHGRLRNTQLNVIKAKKNICSFEHSFNGERQRGLSL